MRLGSRTVAKGLAAIALAVVALIVVVDYCDARGRGGGRGGGGGGRGGFGGGGYGGRAHISNGFHHRPAGGGSYHRPGGGFDRRPHVDNSLPGGRPDRPGGGRPDRPGEGRPDRPGDGGNRPGDGGSYDRPIVGQDNDYYFGWDNPIYGYGAATGLAIGTYVYNIPPNCVYEEHGGLQYRRCGDVWYQAVYEDAGVRFVVVNQPY
jgi:hypothetical protein